MCRQQQGCVRGGVCVGACVCVGRGWGEGGGEVGTHRGQQENVKVRALAVRATGDRIAPQTKAHAQAHWQGFTSSLGVCTACAPRCPPRTPCHAAAAAHAPQLPPLLAAPTLLAARPGGRRQGGTAWRTQRPAQSTPRQVPAFRWPERPRTPRSGRWQGGVQGESVSTLPQGPRSGERQCRSVPASQ